MFYLYAFINLLILVQCVTTEPPLWSYFFRMRDRERGRGGGERERERKREAASWLEPKGLAHGR